MRRIWSVPLVFLVLLLTACGGIPSSGPVREGESVAVEDDFVYDYLPAGPQADQTPDQILLGFLDAATGPRNNYEVAREYLTPAFREVWNPGAGVIVDEERSRSLTTVDEVTRTLLIEPVAEVNELGQYRPVPPSGRVSLGYTFQQIGGQWRIAEAPDGIVLDQAYFREVFSTHALYFFDPQFRFLVPDVRWFPRRASTHAQIVRALLEGPAPWLEGAVVTAFPQGTRTLEAVPLEGAIAVVDLSSEANEADPVALARMRAQLAQSLAPAVTDVRISIEQNPIEFAAVGEVAAADPPRVDPRALVLREGVLGFVPLVDGEGLVPLEGLSEAVAALTPTSITVSGDRLLAAVGSGAGVFAVSAEGDQVLVDDRSGLLAPTLDPLGWIWTTVAGLPGSVLASDPAGGGVTLATPWGDAASVYALAVSRDGTRLAALVTQAEGHRVVVAGIRRDESGRPASLGPELTVAVSPGAPRGLSWGSDSTLLVLSGGGAATQVTEHQVGGTATVLPAPENPVTTVVGGNGPADVRVLTDAGVLLVQRGNGWQERSGGVTVLATVGPTVD